MSSYQSREDAKALLGCLVLSGILLVLALCAGGVALVWKQVL